MLGGMAVTLILTRRTFVAGAAASVLTVSGGPASSALHFDVVVYGATSAGVIAAYAAARENLRVALVVGPNPIGGMTANGLSRSDANAKQPIGGLAGRFFTAMGAHYGLPKAFRFEPHVAEAFFRGLLDEAGIVVFPGDVNERRPLARDGARIKYLLLEDDTHLAGKVFIDASYEGDVMAAAGVSYEVGRDAKRAYSEPTAGFGVAQLPKTKITVRDSAGRLLPLVRPFPSLAIGAADAGVMGFNYRLSLTNVPSDRRPFERPRTYDPDLYLIDLQRSYSGDAFHAGGELPGIAKVDRNNDEPVGANWAYPTATRAVRRQINDFHASYQAGRLYFFATDPRLPQTFRDSVNEWGLSRSEFADNDNWPRQLYVREARRMNGQFKLHQRYTNRGARFADGVLLWGYDYDSHPTQYLADANGKLVIEGSNAKDTPGMGAQRYSMPLRALLPQEHECINLIVPVCASVTRVVNCSYRMEPAYMMAGEAAGVCAAHAVRGASTVQQVNRRGVVLALTGYGAVL